MAMEKFGGSPDRETFDEKTVRTDADREAAKIYSDLAALEGVTIIFGSRSHSLNNYYAAALSNKQYQQLLAEQEVAKLSWGSTRHIDTYKEGYESRHEAVKEAHERHKAATMVEV